MKYKLDFKLILSSAAIAILAAGCQFSSPGNAVSQNNPTQDATDTSAPTEVAQSSEKWSDLNLTDAQKAQMKKIREQTKAKIVTLLSADQQTQFKAASQGTHESSMKVLRRRS